MTRACSDRRNGFKLTQIYIRYWEEVLPYEFISEHVQGQAGACSNLGEWKVSLPTTGGLKLDDL